MIIKPAQNKSESYKVISSATTLNMQFAIHNYASPTATIDATVRAPNAQLPAILSMAKAYGVTSLDKVSGAGTMNLDMHAAGALRSLNAAEITRALNGTIEVDFHNIKY